MNEWMSEWMNERMSEWMNKWVNKWMNEWTNKWMNEWMNEWVNEWMNEWMNERMNEWMNEWVSEWISEWMNEWTNESMNQNIINAGSRWHVPQYHHTAEQCQQCNYRRHLSLSQWAADITGLLITSPENADTKSTHIIADNMTVTGMVWFIPLADVCGECR